MLEDHMEGMGRLPPKQATKRWWIIAVTVMGMSTLWLAGDGY
jgi:hypothetical protein